MWLTADFCRDLLNDEKTNNTCALLYCSVWTEAGSQMDFLLPLLNYGRLHSPSNREREGDVFRERKRYV